MEENLCREAFLEGFNSEIEKSSGIVDKIKGFAKGFKGKAKSYGGKVGETAGQAFGIGLGFAGANIALAGVSKAVESVADALSSSKLSSRHRRFITELLKKDRTLKGRKPEKVVSHYETIVRLAPAISLDENVVSAFLKESTMYDTISTPMVKTLLDIESSSAGVSEKRQKIRTGFFRGESPMYPWEAGKGSNPTKQSRRGYRLGNP